MKKMKKRRAHTHTHGMVHGKYKSKNNSKDGSLKPMAGSAENIYSAIYLDH